MAVDPEVQALALQIAELEEQVRALATARQLSRSSVRVGETAVTVPDALQAGVQAGAVAEEALQGAADALAEAALAKTTADGKNRIFASQTEPAGEHVPGDLWYVLNHLGRVTAVGVYNGSDWVPMSLVANQVLVPGTVGPVLIEDGAVTAEKLAAASVTADKIEAGALTAREVNIAVANLIADPNFEKAEPGVGWGAELAWGWTQFGPDTGITTTDEGPTLHAMSDDVEDNADLQLRSLASIPVAPGDVLHLSFRGKNMLETLVGSVQTATTAAMYVFWYGKGEQLMVDGPFGPVPAVGQLVLGSGVSADDSDVFYSADWTTLSKRVIVPEGADEGRLRLALDVDDYSKGVWMASPRIVREGSAAVKFFAETGELAASLSGSAGTESSTVLMKPEAGAASVGFRATSGADLVLATDTVSVSVKELADTGWVNITMIGGATADAVNPPQVRRYMGMYHLRGVARNVTTTQDCMLLPSGFWPPTSDNHTVQNNSAASTGRLFIRSNGTIRSSDLSGALSLTGIRYLPN